MNQPTNKWQWQQSDQRQRGVDRKQDDGRHHDHQNIGGKVEQVQGQEHIDAIGLAANAGNQVTGTSATKILQRQLQKMLIRGGAQVCANALGHQGQDVRFDPTQPPRHQC